MGLFDFFDMADTYKDRKVDNFEQGDLIVDTALVIDGRHPFETGITWPSEYPATTSWAIVEAYDTKELAQEGHNRWVDIMTNNPPDELVDCQNAEVAQLMDALGGGDRLRFKRKGN